MVQRRNVSPTLISHPPIPATHKQENKLIVRLYVQLMYFCANVSYASLPVYLPTILKNMGYSSINAQGLSAPPYFVAFLFALITTYLGDKTQQRGLVLIGTSLIGGIGYIVLATVKTVGVRYFATFLASAGVFSTIPNILAWTISQSHSPSCPAKDPLYQIYQTLT